MCVVLLLVLLPCPLHPLLHPHTQCAHARCCP
jgi:hypothetical protein